jgi:hypothetical protein
MSRRTLRRCGLRQTSAGLYCRPANPGATAFTVWLASRLSVKQLGEAGLPTSEVRDGAQMDMQIDEIKSEQGLLLVTFSGNLEVEAAVRLVKQTLDTAKEKGINKILLNMFAVNGELSAVERYEIGAEIAAYVKQRQMNPRLAIVGKPPTMTGFAVRVAQNRNLVTNTFSSLQEAMNWLDAWPS